MKKTTMKKTISLILAAVMLLTMLTACGRKSARRTCRNGAVR